MIIAIATKIKIATKKGDIVVPVPVIAESENLSLVMLYGYYQIIHKHTGLRACMFNDRDVAKKCFKELTQLEIPDDVDAIASDKDGINTKMSNIIKYWLEQDSDEEDEY